MTTLVTGATGFLGSHVVDLLVQRGERPRVLVRPADGLGPLREHDVDVFWGDVRDRAALEGGLRGVEHVIHCAAKTGPWGSHADYEETNVRALELLIRAAMEAGVRRLVHVSSIAVHGADVHGTADETSPLRVDPNPYSWSKVAGERILQALIRDEGAPVTIVRPGWIYGPRDTGSFARVARMIESRQAVMVGSGGNHLPLIYVRDAAAGLLLASEAPQVEGRAYVLVNDQSVTQREFLSAIAAQLGVPAPSRHIPYRLATMLGVIAEDLALLPGIQQAPPVTRYGIRLLGGENRFIIDRAKRELGFAPLINLAEGVARSVEWYRHEEEHIERRVKVAA